MLSLFCGISSVWSVSHVIGFFPALQISNTLWSTISTSEIAKKNCECDSVWVGGVRDNGKPRAWYFSNKLKQCVRVKWMRFKEPSQVNISSDFPVSGKP